MADGNVGRVNVELGLDTRNLKKGIKDAVQSLEKIADTAETVGSEAEASFDKAGKATQEFGARGVRAAQDLNKSFFGLEANIKGVETATERYKREMESLTPAVNKAKRSLDDVGKGMTQMGQKLSMSLTLPLVTTGGAAIKMANDFEFAMSSITGLVGINADQVKQMETGVRAMGVEYGRSAKESADALYFIMSAGIEASDAMGVLEASLKASAVGLGETQIIADTVSSAINAYGIANLSASEATDSLVAAVREGKMEADQLAGALPRVLPIASAMGVSFQEVSAAFAAMSLNGTDASEAATQIRGILSSLMNPAKQAEDQLAALGLSGSMLRQVIREDGLLAGLELLTQAFGTNEEAAGLVFGNVRALTGVMSLFGEATDGTKEIFADLTDNTGDLDKAFGAMSQTGMFKVNQAVASMKDAMVSLGQALVPVVVPVLKTIANALASVGRFFTDLPGPIRTVIVVMGGLAAAAGPVLIAVGMMVKAFAALKTAALASAGAQGLGAMGTGLNRLIPILTNPYFLGAAAVAVGIGVAFNAMSKNAQEAEERQKRLTQQLIDANDPTLTLIESVKGLAAAYADAADQTAGLAPAAMNANELFVAGELAAQGFDSAFASAGVSIADLSAELSSGTNEFDAFASRLTQNANGVTGYRDILDQAVAAGMPFAESLRDAYEAGTLLGPQIAEMVTMLDKTADAFDDSREAANNEAKALLYTGDSLTRYNSILGEGFISIRDRAIANAAATGSEYVYADALKAVEDAVDRVEYVQARLNGTTADTTNETKKAVPIVRNLDEVLRGLRDASEEGQASFAALANELNIVGDVLANNLQLMLMDTRDQAVALFNELADGETTFTDVERAVRQSANQIGELVVQTSNLGGKTSDAIPQILQIMDALYDGAQAAGVSRAAVTGLIKEIGFLDQLSPEIALALTLDTAGIEAQIQLLVDQLKSTGGRSGAISQQIDDLGKLLKAVRGAESMRGGGGGGGGDKKNPFDWVKDWVADIKQYTERLFKRDFADKLVASTAPEIADALADVFKEAQKLMIDKLPGGEGLAKLFDSTTIALQGLANQLEDTGDAVRPIEGLRTKFKDAVAEVRRLEDALTDLEDRFKQFNRTEVSGNLTALEALDRGLEKYDQLKSDLESLKQTYQEFASVPSPLETQLESYQRAADAVQAVKDELADLDRMMTGLTGLDLERARLDDLSSSLENLKASQIDFAESTAKGLGTIPFQARGGALGQAKRYLAKVESFRDVISGLRDREFPLEIIREVLSAGIDGGTALGKKLLSLSDADLSELKRVQKSIGEVTGQIGTISANVLFSADVSQAESAFNRQMGLVKQMYAQALVQAEANFASQKAITQGLYEQQIAQAQSVLETQKVVVQGLFQTAIAEAKKNLEDARSVATQLQTALQGVERAMRDFITALLNAIAQAAQQQPPAQGGSTTAPTGGMVPGTNIPAVIGTGDTGAPKPGQVVGGPDRIWGGTGGGGVVDGIYIPPGIDFSKLATGGPARAGSPYMVGELGPELFVPRSSGTVVPNDALGMGGSTYNISVNARGDGADIGRQVVKAIQEYERRNGTGWRA